MTTTLTLKNERRGRATGPRPEIETESVSYLEPTTNGAAVQPDDLSAWKHFLRSTFFNRCDTFAMFNPAKPGEEWRRKFRQLSETDLDAHLNGSAILGAYSLDGNESARWACIDVDAHTDSSDPDRNFRFALDLADHLRGMECFPLVEDSGGGGFHVWILFSDAVPGPALTQWLESAVSFPDGIDGETYPKTGRNGAKSGVSCLVRLPGPRHKEPRGHFSAFWNGEGWTRDLSEIALVEMTPAEIIPPLPMEQPAAMSNGHAQTGSQAALDRVASRQLGDVSKLLDLLNQGRCDSYDEWLKVGMIVHGCDPSDAGLSIWEEWSRNSPKYQSGVCSQKWQTFTGGGGRPVTVGTLRRWAREDSPTEYESFFPKADHKGFDPCAASRELVADEYTATVRTLRRHGEAWWSFDGSVYRNLAKDELETVAWTWLDARFTTARKRMVDETVCSMRAVPGVAVPKEHDGWLDGSTGPEPRNAIEVRNGTIDADSGEFIPVTPSRFRKSAAPFDYDENAGEPANWLNFLDQTFGGDQGAIGVLQEFTGLSLVLDLSHQKILYLHGEPRSGKGTILQVMEGLVGDEGRVSATPKMFDDQFALASMVGKRLCVVPDARFEKGSLTANVVERLLSISAGDSLPVRGMRQIATTARLDARLVICSNTPPSIMSDDALQSRLLPLLTRRSFDKPDTNLFKQRLKPELSSILVWALEGLHRLRRRGSFPEPKPIEQATLEHDLETLRAWMRDRADEGPWTRSDLTNFVQGRVRRHVNDLLPLLVKSGAVRREGSNLYAVGAAG